MKLRSLAAVTAVSTLSLASVAALPAPSANAADAVPGSRAAAWITGELDSGLIKGSYVDTFTDPNNPMVVNYTDYGLSIDVALSLAFLDPDNPTIDTISDALAAEIDEYVIQADQGVPTNAGSLAKAAVLAQAAGDSATSYGGRNLIADLAVRVLDAGASKGRAVNDGFDYRSNVAQAFAAQALDAAGNGEADEALAYLLQQQCAAGFFTQSSPADPDAADQTCDGNSGAPSIDTTALVVLALQDQIADPVVETALGKAVDWLAAQQQTDGTVGGAPNANSTGLAGWVFGISGEAARAADAAVWLRQHQAADPGACSTFPPSVAGAVALDDLGYTNLQNGMQIHDETAEVRRATAQAVPALTFAPSGGTATITVPTGFVQAGTSQKVKLAGLAPADTVCVGTKQALAGNAGKLTVTVSIPAGTGTRTFAVVRTAGKVGNAVFRALGKQTLGVKVADGSVKKGASQVVTVSKLAPREKYVIKVGGTVVKSGKAGPKGQAQVRFPAAGKPGPVKVTVTGQFASIRKGSASFRITR